MKNNIPEETTGRFKMAVYITGGEHRGGVDCQILMMKRMKSRKEYHCDDCNRTIKRGEQYFCLDMSPGQYSQLYESFDHENLSIIKRACVRCVEKEFTERTASKAERIAELEREREMYRLLEKGILNHPEARA